MSWCLYQNLPCLHTSDLISMDATEHGNTGTASTKLPNVAWPPKCHANGYDVRLKTHHKYVLHHATYIYILRVIVYGHCVLHLTSSLLMYSFSKWDCSLHPSPASATHPTSYVQERVCKVSWLSPPDPHGVRDQKFLSNDFSNLNDLRWRKGHSPQLCMHLIRSIHVKRYRDVQSVLQGIDISSDLVMMKWSRYDPHLDWTLEPKRKQLKIVSDVSLCTFVQQLLPCLLLSSCPSCFCDRITCRHEWHMRPLKNQSERISKSNG